MTRPYVLFALYLGLFGLAADGLPDDWPMHRHDTRRSGVTEDRPGFPLQRVWTFRSPQAPRPAWPPQPKLLDRTDYDYAAGLAVAEGMVAFGSSADDTVRSLDLATGGERWHFTAGGPVRLAPQIHRGRVYFTADDGWVYCLDGQTGRPVWTFRAGPWDDRMIGNGRMISRWPCRTGVLVAGDTLYTTSGLFPSEGITIYALDADTGAIRWQNDTAGLLGQGFVDSVSGGHQGEFAFRGLCPEGPLLLDQGVLLVPQGHASPVRIDARTGRVLRRENPMEAARQYAARLVQRHVEAGNPPPGQDLIERMARSLAGRSGGLPGGGGTWIAIDQGKYYVLAMHRSRRTYLNAWDLGTGLAEGLLHSDRVLPQLTKAGPNRSLLPGRVSVVVQGGQIYGRNAFDLILAGGTLMVGEDGAVSAVDAATGEEVWRASVDGEARELAVAGGRLLVSTRSGEIACFASTAETPERLAASPVPPAKKTLVTPRPPRLSAGAQTALARIRAAGMDRGYALVLGDADGTFAETLAQETALHVIVGLRRQSDVATLRERLLRETVLYGTRIHVLWMERPGALPTAQLFANAVVVISPGDVPPPELYRVLRPCGGILLAPGLDREAAAAMLAKTGAAAAELHVDGPLPEVVRGPLPGANDFDHRVPDPRVRWPLQPLWFGGPDPVLLADHRSGEHFAGPPVAARGRYFVQGETTLTAVDAYNGTVLWTRPAPKPWLEVRVVAGQMRKAENFGPPAVPVDEHWRVRLGRRLTADGEHVYLHLGSDYFRGCGPGVVRLDARSGRPLGMFGPHVAGPDVSLEEPKSWVFRFPEAGAEGVAAGKDPDPPTLETFQERNAAYHAAMRVESEAAGKAGLPPEAGLLTLAAEDDAVLVRLVTRETIATRFDGWDLFFDFRRRAERYGLYGEETFAVRVVPTPGGDRPAQWEALAGSPPDVIHLDRQSTDAGSETVLRLKRDEIEHWLGRRPDGFGFAATYRSDTGANDPEAPLRLRHLFGDARAQGINVGWANVWLGAVPESPAPAASAVLLGPHADSPRPWHAPAAMVPGDIDESVRTAHRVHPLTGEPGPKVYRSGTWACGGPSFSATCVFRRSSKPGLGIYDFADDSGLRFFGGVSAPCGTSSTAALGLLLFSESRFRCDCNPPLKTSFALGPAERVYHEDWAIFYDRPADGRVRSAAINLGAFGDRRDSGGRLWLAYPRDFDRGYGYPLRPASRGKLQTFPGQYLRHVPAALLLPVEVEVDPAQGPYRVNSDRVTVRGTDRPWLYGSGIRGIRKAVVRVDLLRPMASARAGSAVEPDGVLDEPAWQGPSTIRLPHTGTEVLLRHDDQRLYVAARRDAIMDRKGHPVPWARSVAGRDGDVWNDDSLELFLSDAREETVLHFGLSASGAALDARIVGEGEEDRAWDAGWQHGVSANDRQLVFEAALPLAALRRAGLVPDALRVNVMVNQSDTRGDAAKYPGGEGRNWQLPNPTGEALAYLGPRGRRRPTNFAPLGFGRVPPYPERRFTVRLHFAELDDVTAGERVFDVKLQGRTVQEHFDVARESGGLRRAIVREFRDVPAAERIVLEFVARDGNPRASPPLGPILSALEVVAPQQ